MRSKAIIFMGLGMKFEIKKFKMSSDKVRGATKLEIIFSVKISDNVRKSKVCLINARNHVILGRTSLSLYKY